MAQKLLFVFCLITCTGAVCMAQSRVITNADLEKYRIEQARAKQDLRDNYAKLGFASPEEIEKRNADSTKALIETAQRLRDQRLQEERLQADREAVAAQLAAVYYSGLATQNGSGYYDDYLGGYFGGGSGYGGYGGYGGRKLGRGFPRMQNVQGGYFAGGMFIPAGPRTPVQPIFVTPRANPGPHR